ncbi:TRAP transporter substrate-binding protein [Ruegeria marina]|uniref:TRAP-type C4-dicarboxylate transport system, substrate-binding protein n=1 Tax=Ruegeria marina TaxID=639004 RepID=A0A1G7FGR6_9RHOB|nr:TRAP transporter substrate-binding protein DctP [Ruegeria marina]SDE74745.1 TRAP-type C4-dicarboxylate transport system, substrate-binding protein [Ruegeria marina]
MLNPKSIALAAISALALGAPAVAETTLRLATAAPQGTPWANQLDRFAAAVDTETAGKVKIEVFYNSQLGSEQDVLAQVARGRIDIGYFSNTSASLQVPEAIFPSLYMYFDDQEERSCILDNHMLEPTRNAFGTRSLYLIGFGEVGPNHVVGKTGAATPAENEGRKIGVSVSPIANSFWETQGMIPTSVPIAESASSMQTGIVDYTLFPITFYVASGLNKIAPVITLAGVQQNSAVLLMSERVRNGLSEEQQAAIDRAWAVVPATQLREEILGFEAKLLEAHKAGGGTVVELTPEQEAAWRAPMDGFYEKAVELTGEAGRDMFEALEAGRAACAK